MRFRTYAPHIGKRPEDLIEAAIMYEAYFNLASAPFAVTPDPRYVYLTTRHQEALAHLQYGILQPGGFVQLTGEVGTGKTTLCRTLLQRIEPGSEIAFLFNPQLSGLELLQAINSEFGLETQGKTRRELMDQLNRFLLTKRQEGRRVLLLIDEAQNLEREALEQVRLLSNLETDTAKLIQIILLAQPELDVILESPELRQLRQRINVRWRLRPLSASETRDYVRHRLRVAAGGAREIFSDFALREIHRRSGGVPRIINRLCDRALLAGYAEGVKEIGLGTVAEVQREFDGRDDAATRSDESSLSERLHTHRLELGAAAGAFIAVALSAGVMWWNANREPAPDAAARAPAVARAPGPVSAPASVDAPPPALSPPQDPPPPAQPTEETGSVPVDLGSALAHSSPAATVAASLDALLRRWGSEPLGADVLSLPQFGELLENTGFAVLSLEGANLELLAAIDRPALVVLSALDGAPRGLLLSGIEGDVATLEGVTPTPLRVPLSELAAHWSGQAFVPWKDHATLPRLIGPGASGASVRWLQEALAKLGFYEGEWNGAFGTTTQTAVRAFQSEESLPVDGWVGPLTLIRLYERLPGYAAPPRLASTAAVRPVAGHGGTS